jgi:hypothetical protein
MKSRREFLQMGVAALTLPIAASASDPFPPGVSSQPGESAPVPLYKVVFDTRFLDSIAFADEAKSLGALVHGIRGDITDLWFHDLDARWKKGPAAIAGLTAHGPIFCLEQLAWSQWSHRMRVVFRAEHKFLPDRRIEHALWGPESMLLQASDLRGSGDRWATRVANLVTRCPSVRSAPERATIVAPLAKPAQQDRETLISWVIAPVSRA